MTHATWTSIRRTILAGASLVILSFLSACTNKAAAGPHATILMRDGTTLSGTVTATSPSEITLAGDDNTAHTVPMTQVKSIEYGDATAAPGSASAARRASDSLHERHYHPTRAEIRTRTYLVPAGTRVSV